MRYFVLGAGGQLGRDLRARLGERAVPLTRAEADLTQPETLRAALADVGRADVVVNCAAYNLVDRAESEPRVAFAVNAWGVRDLALLCAKLGCTLVHFSSDYVFGLDTDHCVPWTEEDARQVSTYGLSKLAGEYLVRALCPRHVVVRTCGLYGAWGVGGKGGNFVETMLRVAGQGKPLRVVADQVCTPSCTADVADATLALIATGRTGLYHVTNSGSCSWHDFARAIFELSGVAVNLSPISSAEYAAAAGRPPYSVLAGTALASAGVPPLRPWRAALSAYLQERRSRSQPGPIV